jgi:hypothetical protein
VPSCSAGELLVFLGDPLFNFLPGNVGPGHRWLTKTERNKEDAQTGNAAL